MSMFKLQSFTNSTVDSTSRTQGASVLTQKHPRTLWGFLKT